jgi:2-isopropylmalate synthase
MGSDVFKTSAGVHAAAILKAHQIRNPILKDSVYSSIPARLLGREQEVLIDSASGVSNVKYWLNVNGLEVSPAVIDKILETAKGKSQPLEDHEIRSIIGSCMSTKAMVSSAR